MVISVATKFLIQQSFDSLITKFLIVLVFTITCSTMYQGQSSKEVDEAKANPIKDANDDKPTFQMQLRPSGSKHPAESTDQEHSYKNINHQKGAVTRKVNHIKLLMESALNLDAVKLQLVQLECSFDKLRHSFNLMASDCKIKSERDEIYQSLSKEEMKFNNIKAEVIAWTDSVEGRSPSTSVNLVDPQAPPTGLKGESAKSIPTVNPDDSISQAGGQTYKTGCSVLSSIYKAKAEEAVKEAELQIELASMEEELEHELQQKKFEIEQKKFDMRRKERDLKVKLAKAEARGQVYSNLALEISSNKSGHSGTGTKRSSRRPSIVVLSKPLMNRIEVDDRRELMEHEVCHSTNANRSADKPVSFQYRMNTEFKPRVLNERKPNEETSNNHDSPQSSSHNHHPGLESSQHFTSSPSPHVLHGVPLQTMNSLNEIMDRQQRCLSALTSPNVGIPTFDGQESTFYSFMRAFDRLVHDKILDNDRRFFLLEQHTSGHAAEIVKGCEYIRNPEEAYFKARKLLFEKYGNSYQIAMNALKKITIGPRIANDDKGALESFAVSLTSCRTMLDNLGYSHRINSPDILLKIVEKLPYRLQDSWLSRADTITYERFEEITIDHISNFLSKKVRECSHPVFGNLPARKSGWKDERNKGFKVKSKKTTFSTKVNDPSSCLYCGKSGHIIDKCFKFEKQTQDVRYKYVVDKHLCFRCLETNHMASKCESKEKCQIPDCTRQHHTLLHRFTASQSNNSSQPPLDTDNVVPSSMENSTVNSLSAHTVTNASTALAIVPVHVRVKGSSQSVLVNAFLDNGSDTSFCTHGLLSRLGVEGIRTTIMLTTMGENAKEMKSCIVKNLEISDIYESKYYDLPDVFTRPTIPISTEDIPTQGDVERWPHLKGVYLPEVKSEVSLLISSNVPDVVQPLEVIHTSNGGPYATRTALGWTLNGPLGRHKAKGGSSKSFYVKTMEHPMCKLCTELVDAYDYGEKAMSADQLKFMKKVNDSIVHKDDMHYEIALPFKNDDVMLPNNYVQAKKRMNHLKKRFQNDPKFHKDYKAFIEDMLNQEYAEEVTCMEAPSGKTWFVPHHGVYHPAKPGKIRVVFDCAAQYQGTCLNDHLLQGPDLTNSLIGVLMRFRQENVAFMSDIKSMFHQVHIPNYQTSFFQFLWWKDGDYEAELKTYCMKVYIFGTNTSPSCANFALRRTAEDNASKFSPVTIETVMRHFYVDDCVASFSSESMAIRTAKELKSLLSLGGFNLTKWTSNSKKLLEKFPLEERSNAVQDLCLDESSILTEKALGIRWHVNDDNLQFTSKIKERPYTRRGILAVVASVYDPLGFLSPFVLPVKIMLRSICQQKYDWDDTLPEEHVTSWKIWLNSLRVISRFSVNRCIKPKDFGEIIHCEVHHLADASEKAFGCVSYVRLRNNEDAIHCSFLYGKSKLTPLKVMTIPRLELAAATLAIKAKILISRECDFNIDKHIFWSDSQTVLKYIYNESVQFHIYVANRVEFIRANSNISDWHYITSKLNSADYASRGLSAEDFTKCKAWISGPKFLWEDYAMTNDPICISPQDDHDPEIKLSFVTINQTKIQEEDVISKMLCKFSSWMKIIKVIAWILRYLKNLKTASQSEDISTQAETRFHLLQQDNPPKLAKLCPDEIKRAELLIIKRQQWLYYEEEIGCMLAKSYVKKESSLCQLDPFLDADGVLRVGGRLKKSNFPEDSKHPYIIPKKSHLAELLVQHEHIRSGHSGRQHVIASLRKRYWIVNANATVRKILDKCVVCRRLYCSPGQQKMADLPPDRLDADKPPFTNVGLDCFGPFLVRRGRSQVKNYGVIFTCLTVRAIHLEVVESLESDSFLMALRRFIARRGNVKLIRSDNGTNFVGAEAELRSTIKDWNQEKIHGALLQKHIRWLFNPPTSSHFGGVWERCIRTVRKTLKGLLNQQTMTTEVLRTLFCEVEYIVNERPLTPVSNDPNDLRVLTPNSILLPNDDVHFPPGLFFKEDLYVKRRWKQVQYMSDHFWKRWLHEYIPLLQLRQKWQRKKVNFQEGDMVLIVNELYPRNRWNLGRILKVFPDDNNLVRQVQLKTLNGTFTRPISKICLISPI